MNSYKDKKNRYNRKPNKTSTRTHRLSRSLVFNSQFNPKFSDLFEVRLENMVNNQEKRLFQKKKEDIKYGGTAIKSNRKEKLVFRP